MRLCNSEKGMSGITETLTDCIQKIDVSQLVKESYSKAKSGKTLLKIA